MDQPGRSRRGAPSADLARLHVCNVLLLSLLWAFSVLAWPELPERIPGHIGLSGVTRWEPRSPGAWFMLPIIGTFSAGLMYVLSFAFTTAAPGINVPHRQRIARLPPEAQRHMLEPARSFMLLMAGWLLALMTGVQWMLFTAARAGPDWQGGTIAAALLAFTLLPLAGVLWLSRAIGERLRLWEEDADR